MFSAGAGMVPAEMYRFLVTPRWLGFHLLVAVVIVTMVNLGFWQLRRLDFKRERAADTIAARIDLAPVPLDTLLPLSLAATDEAPADAEWRSIVADGHYLPDAEFIVVNRSQDGLAGDMTVTPLQMDDGRILLVERGFVPVGASAEAAPAPTGDVEVIGRLRRSQRHAPGQLSDPSTGVITEAQQFDVPRLAEQMPGPVVPMYVELTSSTPAEAGPYPAPVDAPDRDLGPHLSYAIQWFIFSICVAVGWVLAVRRSLATHRRAVDVTSRHEAAVGDRRQLPQHGDVQRVRPRLVAQPLRPDRRTGRRRAGSDQAADPRAHRRAHPVPAPAGRGAARARPAVLDRGPRLRHRLPRPPPRRAASGHSRAARRRGQPHPGPARSTGASRCGSST